MGSESLARFCSASGVEYRLRDQVRADSIVTAAVTVPVAIPKKPPDFHKHPGAELELEGGTREDRSPRA